MGRVVPEPLPRMRAMRIDTSTQTGPCIVLIFGTRPSRLLPQPIICLRWGIPQGGGGAQTAHHATSSTAPTHQLLGSANAETTPARAPAAAADRTQRPDATCEGKNG